MGLLKTIAGTYTMMPTDSYKSQWLIWRCGTLTALSDEFKWLSLGLGHPYDSPSNIRPGDMLVGEIYLSTTHITFSNRTRLSAYGSLYVSQLGTCLLLVILFATCFAERRYMIES